MRLIVWSFSFMEVVTNAYQPLMSIIESLKAFDDLPSSCLSIFGRSVVQLLLNFTADFHYFTDSCVKILLSTHGFHLVGLDNNCHEKRQWNLQGLKQLPNSEEIVCLLSPPLSFRYLL